MARSLFGSVDADPGEFASPQCVEREVPYQGYRADLVIHWRCGWSTHVEVKTGDEDLAKTFRTGEKMMAKFGAARNGWTHFVLLLSPQLESWMEVAQVSSSDLTVGAVTWDDVCVAIRRALLGHELVTWKAWAWAFLGAIEQKLIGYDRAVPLSLSGAALESKVEILKRGLGDDG